ncbi:hypothetical protein GGR50DRAFT_236294 [Xylaria sp. CBS 124048]|nr:hypothetical protein GGR50DRAFT_236294 [Xylaria sp. CBS 124048]
MMLGLLLRGFWGLLSRGQPLLTGTLSYAALTHVYCTGILVYMSPFPRDAVLFFTLSIERDRRRGREREGGRGEREWRDIVNSEMYYQERNCLVSTDGACIHDGSRPFGDSFSRRGFAEGWRLMRVGSLLPTRLGT